MPGPGLTGGRRRCWTGGACDQLVYIEVDAAGRLATVSTAVSPAACDAIGIDRLVELQFAGSVDAATFHGRVGAAFPVPPAIQPSPVAFTDPSHGFVGGTDALGGAVVEETSDAGTRWDPAVLGWGRVVGLGVDETGRAWAAFTCDPTDATCAPGIYRGHGTRWSRILDVQPWGLSVSGHAVLAAAPAASVGVSIRSLDLRLSGNGGATWTTIADPCPGAMPLQAASLAGPSTIVAVCEGGAATGMSMKQLVRSTNSGRTWTKLADGPYAGTGSAIDILADGTGWFWAPWWHLLATRDGGRTWTPLTVADGDARIVNGADTWGGGAGVALVWDPNRRATLLLRMADGKAWTEMASFPVPPTSGGG